MAPLALPNLARLASFYSKEPDPLPLSVTVLGSVALTLLYVLPFYLSSTTRPSPTLSRDAPSVIRARIRIVTAACVVSELAVSCLIVEQGGISLRDALRLQGWWPVGVGEVARSLLLTAILFTGPLFERVVESGGRDLLPSVSGWIGWRNYVAGPVTEEVIFRSAIIPLHLLCKMPAARIVFVAPLYFGIAHIHHFYEFTLTHPHASLLGALLRSLFQFAYTTLFGWYATFVYLRTGSLAAVILVHSFCNWCGLPRLWGRLEPVPRSPLVLPPATAAAVRGKEDGDLSGGGSATLGIGWTIAYYLLLVAGAVGFWHQLWPLTQSSHALVSFSAK